MVEMKMKKCFLKLFSLSLLFHFTKGVELRNSIIVFFLSIILACLFQSNFVDWKQKNFGHENKPPQNIIGKNDVH